MNGILRYLIYFITIVLYFLVIGLWISIPEELVLNISVSIFTIALTLFLIIVDRNKFKVYYNSTQFKGLTSALISVALFFCIIALLNYLVFKHPLHVDFSRNQFNSLTIETIQSLKQIEGKIHLKVFAQKKNAKAILDLLDLYRFYKNDIDIKYIDMEINPIEVKKYRITKGNIIVVEYNQKKEWIENISELDITNAFIRVSRKYDPVAYYSIGHNEILLEDKGPQGLSAVKALFKDNNINVVPINLAIENRLPQELNALIIWGPKLVFQEKELFLISEYLASGGKLLVALDPNPDRDLTPALRKLISKYGINLPNDLVVDQNSFVSGSKGSVPLITNYSKKHIITNDFTGNIFFPLVSSVTKSKTPSVEGKFNALAFTSSYPSSWAEKNPKEIFSGKITFNKYVDRKGPISVVGSWEQAGGNEKKTKIIAFGNSSFIINSYKKFTNNFKFFLKTISWLIDDNKIKSFNVSRKKEDPIFIGSTQIGVIFYFSVIFAPLMLFGFSFYLYKKRQKL